jgi:hypothetical protein
VRSEKVVISTAPSTLDAAVRNYVETSSSQLDGGYLSFPHFLANGALLYGVPIKNNVTTSSVAPILANILDMNLHNNDTTLVNTMPASHTDCPTPVHNLETKSVLWPCPWKDAQPS